MTITHAGIVKLAMASSAVISAGITAITEPSIKVAIITGVSFVTAALIGSITTVILGVMTYRQNAKAFALQQVMHQGQQDTREIVDKVQVQTDGINSKLFAKSEKQGEQLAVKSSEADRAAGREQERVEERDRQNESH
jgi:basic membrane lipoprotein Med (substrate-binding protein (PBP1-ABC) superfamily)